MATFKYTAVGADGVAITSTGEAASIASLENDLLRQGLSATKIREKKGFNFDVTKEKVPKAEIMHFSRQLAAFVRSGIPINEALRVVGEGAGNKRFKAILGDIEEALQGGVPFSDAVSLHSSVFPPYYVSILRSAEMTGQLDIVLDQLSLYIERDLEARSKVKAAITYPAVIMLMSIATMFIMVLFVLPRFVVFFKDLHSKLPLPTRMLLGFSTFMSTWWWLLLSIVIVFIAIYIISGKTEGGMYARHKVFLNIPLIGQIVEYSAIERFCRVIAAMMRAGVPLPDAMASAIESTNNKVFERGLVEARDLMIQGDGIAGPIAASGLFPVAAVSMIKVGEETGTLDQQVDGAAQFYGRELEYKLKKLTTLFEPAVILFMGFVVGFVAVALISAMYGVLQGQKDKS